MSNEIQRIQSSPMAMAVEFIKNDSNVDVEKLAKLLDVQERWEANEAKKAYVEAMAQFKANPPKIIKDRHVKFNTSKGVTEYYHASLENVAATISEALSRVGLTASWTTEQGEVAVKVTCRITHVSGHSEETSLSACPDTSGSKNPIQAIGSAVTYLQRYTLLSLVGLATEGQDDDAISAAKNGAPKSNEKARADFAAITKKDPLDDAAKDVLASIYENVKDIIPDRFEAAVEAYKVFDNKWPDAKHGRGVIEQLKSLYAEKKQCQTSTK